MAGADSSQPKSLWVPWADKNSQPSGFISEFSNNLTFVTIRGAGYQIGQFQPQRLHLIFSSFVTSTNNRSNGVKVDSALLTALIATAGTFLFLIVIVVGVFINYSKSATVKARAREVVDGSAGVEDTDENNNQNRCSGINLTSIRSSTVSIDEK